MPDTFLASNLALRLIPDSPQSSSRAKKQENGGGGDFFLPCACASSGREGEALCTYVRTTVRAVGRSLSAYMCAGGGCAATAIAPRRGNKNYFF